MRRELRPRQVRGIELIRQSLREGKRYPIFQGPCGLGKSLIMAAIAEMSLNKNKRTLVTVPTLDLVDQMVQSFHDEGICEIGVIQGQHEMTDWSQPIQIASVQTLLRRTIPDVGNILIDEAHRVFKYYEKLLGWARENNVPAIGFTATPFTKGLGKLFDNLLVGGTTAEMIQSGELCDFRSFGGELPDLSKVRTLAGDYHQEDLAEATNKPKLVADILQTWQRLGENSSTLGFAVDCLHAKNLTDKFNAAGIPTAYVDAYTSREERKAIRDGFQSSDIKVIWNVGVYNTGTDLDVRCIIDAHPTKSEILHCQTRGRGLRNAEGKPFVRFLDHAGNDERLGYVTDIHYDELDDGSLKSKKEVIAKERLPKRCPKCSFIRPPSSIGCSNCGWKPELKSKVVCRSGDLVERSRNSLTQAEIDLRDRRRFYGELKSLASWHGYKEGWCANQYREKHGEWPPEHIKSAPKADPSLATQSFVKSRLIRYVKNKQREQQQLKALVRPEIR